MIILYAVTISNLAGLKFVYQLNISAPRFVRVLPLTFRPGIVLGSPNKICKSGTFAAYVSGRTLLVQAV